MANVFLTKDRNAEEMLTKGFNDHFVDIERIDYSWIFKFDCCVSSFSNNRARESRFLQNEEAKRIRPQQMQNLI